MAESRQNIALVRTLYQAFADRDIPSMLAVLSPTVEWGEPSNPLNPAGGTRHGHDGFLEWVRIGNEAEEVLFLEPRDFLSNSESVAVVGFTRCRVRKTGKLYETDFVHLITLRDGKVERFREFFDTFAAAEAFRPSADGT
jgi:uncharacterized protein